MQGNQICSLKERWKSDRSTVKKKKLLKSDQTGYHRTVNKDLPKFYSTLVTIKLLGTIINFTLLFHFRSGGTIFGEFWPSGAQTKYTKIQFFIILSKWRNFSGKSSKYKLFLISFHIKCSIRKKKKMFSGHTSIKSWNCVEQVLFSFAQPNDRNWIFC